MAKRFIVEKMKIDGSGALVKATYKDAVKSKLYVKCY